MIGSSPHRLRYLILFAVILGLALALLPRTASFGQGDPGTPPPADVDGWRTYPNTHPWLAYGGTWQTFPVTAAAGGALTASDDPAASLVIRFQGTGIRVLYARGPEGGTFTGQVDWLMTQGDSHADRYSYGHVLVFPGLPPGEHTFTLTNSSGAVWIEAVQVQGTLLEPVSLPTATPAPDQDATWTTYQDTDPRLVYEGGTWQTFPVADANGGTLTGTADPGATLTVYFEGTGIRVLHSVGPEGRSLTAQVDGGTIQTADGYADGYSYEHPLSFEGLSDGRHTLTVTNGEGAIWIEAIQIQGLLLDPLDTEPDMTLLFSDDFDDGGSDRWWVGGTQVSELVTPHDTGQALRMAGQAAPVHLMLEELREYAVQTQLRIEQGIAIVGIHRTDVGQYILTIHKSGFVELYFDDLLLETATIAPAALDEWITLRVLVLDDTLRVRINGIETLSIPAANLFLPGTVNIRADITGSSVFQVDDFEIWVPADRLPSSVPPTPAPGAGVIMSVVPDDLGIGTTSQMAHVHFEAGNNQLYVNNLPVATVGSNIFMGSPAWDPDGEQIAYPHAYIPDRIVIRDPEGTWLRSITIDAGFAIDFVSHLTWSPDGTRLAFEIHPWDYGSIKHKIYYVDANCPQGSTCQAYRVTDASFTNYEYSPTWLDNQTLAFIASYSVWAAQLGALPVSITAPTTNYLSGLDASPDGTWMALSSRQSDGAYVIQKVARASGAFTQLTTTQPLPYQDQEPTISPAGDNVAFVRYNYQTGARELFYVPVDAPGTEDSIAGYVAVHDPGWGPRQSPEQEYYEQFIGIMFWAIYNETNGNQQVPLSEVLPAVTPSIENTVLDVDHRYAMARTMLNIIPLNNVGKGVDTMRQRWGGSVGKTNAEILSIQGSNRCQWSGSEIGTYADALRTSYPEVLRWFNGYLNCFRTGELLAGNLTNFDTADSQITGYVRQAIQHHIAGDPNPVPGAQYVKGTSSCFVWHRDTSGKKTGCRGDGGEIDMLSFCNEAPVGRTNPEPNRNCRASSVNPDNVIVAEWLNSEEGRFSNQQLNLQTTVGRSYSINLGLYTPDQPLRDEQGDPTSGQGCEFGCYFLLGNPDVDSTKTGGIWGEDEEAAWYRHAARYENRDYGYTPDAPSYYIHVLRTERGGAKTWITFVFQTE